MILISDTIIVGLDVGTVKVCAAIGEYGYDKNGMPRLNIIGMGEAPSDGVRNGVVINIESTLRRIIEAVESAEHMSGTTVKSVVCGIGGAHIKGINSRGVAAVAGEGGDKNREITRNDIYRAVESASAVALSLDKARLHVIPREYIIDGNGGIKDPLNMIGTRLESEVHVIYGTVTAVQNLEKCVNRAGYEVEESVFLPLAGCFAVMTPDENKSGLLLINLGGGTTDIVVSMEGTPYYTGVIPIGGNKVTNDLSIVLKLPREIAEKIKLTEGVCHESLIREDEEIILPISVSAGRPDNVVMRSEVCEIIKARVLEIFSKIDEQLADTGCMKMLNGGIILTGGGALMPGICELAGEYFQMPVRIGYPEGLSGPVQEFRDPRYADVIGLVRYIDYKRRREVDAVSAKKEESGIRSKIWKWLKEFF